MQISYSTKNFLTVSTEEAVKKPDNFSQRQRTFSSNQILPPLGSKIAANNSPKPNTASQYSSIDMSHCSTISKQGNTRKSDFATESKWICYNGSIVSPIKQVRSVNFDTDLKSTVRRRGDRFFRSFVSEKDQHIGNYFMSDVLRKNQASMRILSLNDFEIPSNNDHMELSQYRNNSMFELEIQPLLEDEEEGFGFLQPSEKGSAEQINKSISSHAKTWLNYLSRSRQASVGKKKETVAASRHEIKRNNYPVRRKSCTCKQCGSSTKLAKASTIILAEDFEKRNQITNSEQSKVSEKSGSPSTFKRKLKISRTTFVPTNINQLYRKTGNKVAYSIPLDRCQLRFEPVLEKKEPESAGDKIGGSSNPNEIETASESQTKISHPLTAKEVPIRRETCKKKYSKNSKTLKIDTEVLGSKDKQKQEKKGKLLKNEIIARRASLKAAFQISLSRKSQTLTFVSANTVTASNLLPDKAEVVISLNELSEGCDQNEGACSSSNLVVSDGMHKASKQNPSLPLTSQGSRTNTTTVDSETDLNCASLPRTDSLAGEKIILITDSTPRNKITKKQWFSENCIENKLGLMMTAKSSKKTHMSPTLHDKYREDYSSNWYTNPKDRKLPSLQERMINTYITRPRLDHLKTMTTSQKKSPKKLGLATGANTTTAVPDKISSQKTLPQKAKIV